MFSTVPVTIFLLWNLYFTLNICEDFKNLMNILVTRAQLGVTLSMYSVWTNILIVFSRAMMFQFDITVSVQSGRAYIFTDCFRSTSRSLQ
jgi:hypothetical protein